MKRFERVELIRFLKQVDELLEEPVAIEIIGGAAATLGYGATRTTRDIDTFTPVPANLRHAAQRARQMTGLDIPLEKAGIADPPYNYEDRRQKLRAPFEQLTVWIPERHDLVLMKTVRAERHDLEVIEEMHRAKPLRLEVLVDRFESEMGQATIDPKILRIQFQLVIERLFGSAAARKVATKAAKRSAPTGSRKKRRGLIKV